MFSDTGARGPEVQLTILSPLKTLLVNKAEGEGVILLFVLGESRHSSFTQGDGEGVAGCYVYRNSLPAYQEVGLLCIQVLRGSFV